MKSKDITGIKFGKLTAIKFNNSKRTPSGQIKHYWLCECECGNFKIVQKAKLINGETKSCGCYKKEFMSRSKTKHKLINTRLYNTWLNMKKRCLNAKYREYHNYGGRGITICDEWINDFLSFYNWAMKNGYSDDLSIDRINNNGNYEPDNCRWANNFTQARNKRTNHILTYNGQTKCLNEWAEIIGITSSAIRHRVYRGWDLDKIFNYKK